MISNLTNLILENRNLFSALLLIPFSFLACKSLYDSYEILFKHHEEVKLFKERHNCVVMYRDKVFTGWPPIGKQIKSNIVKDSIAELYEPLHYFITTAQFSLDVALMTISMKPIYKALSQAANRGVKVRLLLNFEHAHVCKEDIKDLLRQGKNFVCKLAIFNEGF